MIATPSVHETAQEPPSAGQPGLVIIENPVVAGIQFEV